MTQNSTGWEEANQSGKFDSAALYKELRGDCIDVPWKKMFFKNHVSPIERFTLWLTLMERLPTKDRLVRFGFSQDNTCCFCKKEETLDHLFFCSEFTNRIWGKMLVWNGYHRSILPWDSERQWLISETSKKGWRREILKITFAETIYQLWLTRNDVVFNHNPPRLDIHNGIQERIIGRSLTNRKLSIHVDVSLMSLR
ncbi:uncharacterized protein LOC131640351 [Vicia villosa]|uniref:uncharacterized protein LOC131640351 n=1 Tax=Vicia villosa TaxID=3911 RepID=UPI00273B888C|nr:uncharacterized protein LOC131640351 [Vicia villosa]